MKLKNTKTNRGFAVVEFIDRYGVPSSIQKSSLATEDAIWFGIDGPDNICTRMSLTREQVKALLPVLKHFVKTGELPE